MLSCGSYARHSQGGGDICHQAHGLPQFNHLTSFSQLTWESIVYYKTPENPVSIYHFIFKFSLISNIVFIIIIQTRINSLRESGIFDHIMMVCINPRRLGPDYIDKIIVEPQEFDDFSYPHLRGLFCLYTFISLLSFIVFSIEIYKHENEPKI